MMSEVTFSPLSRNDFLLLHRWLGDPEVVRWYSKRPQTMESIERKYGPRVNGQVPTYVYIASVDGNQAGLIQTYRVADHAEYASAIEAENDWAGLDYFIGEAGFRGKGLAPRIIVHFLNEVVARLPNTSACVSGPTPDNIRSIRCLQRAGFVFLRKVEERPGQWVNLMIKRPIAGNAG